MANTSIVVADGSGENIFVVKDEVISTPDLSASILPGITRQAVMEIAQTLGYAVHERQRWISLCGFSLTLLGLLGLGALFALDNARRQLKGERKQASGEFRWR